METPLNASSATAGALFAGNRFRVPQFQREYAWGKDEVEEFFSDLSKALRDDSYFLGLVILTGKGGIKDVVDGQQRILTLTLLAAAIYHRARAYERNALAERMQSNFLRSLDFDSDKERPRVQLSSDVDNETLKSILEKPAEELANLDPHDDSVSALLLSAYRAISSRLDADLVEDPFKRLGLWADFLSNKLYLANFVHPNPASAYRVFEVINTRGKELTTADLLKNYVLSQTKQDDKQARYEQWQAVARRFGSENASAFVQFIRHVVTTERGYVEPRELYDELATGGTSRHQPMTPSHLMGLMEKSLPLYLQTMDPTVDGPATEGQLGVFSVLQRLNVISVRPILLAMAACPDATEGMEQLLRLVVRRIVVGNLGTGAVERRFGQAAHRIATDRRWQPALEALADLNPGSDEFRSQVHQRNLNRNVLTVIRQSVIQRSIIPEPDGYLYFIKPRDAEWPEDDQDRVAFWATTIGNSILASEARRPMGTSSWAGFRAALLPKAVEGEWVDDIKAHSSWGIDEIDSLGGKIADSAADVWYA